MYLTLQDMLLLYEVQDVAELLLSMNGVLTIYKYLPCLAAKVDNFALIVLLFSDAVKAIYTPPSMIKTSSNSENRRQLVDGLRDSDWSSRPTKRQWVMVNLGGFVNIRTINFHNKNILSKSYTRNIYSVNNFFSIMRKFR